LPQRLLGLDRSHGASGCRISLILRRAKVPVRVLQPHVEVLDPGAKIVGPVLRPLRRDTDPLFRRAGLDPRRF
jgi:hypothetical protein